jgi:hypothetical protein
VHCNRYRSATKRTNLFPLREIRGAELSTDDGEQKHVNIIPSQAEKWENRRENTGTVSRMMGNQF